MRARKKKNLVPRLEKCRAYIAQTITPSARPLLLEIGCGKGKFITSMAADLPETDFYALEKVPDVLVMAAEKATAQELQNLRFLIADAAKLPDLCPERSVDTIFLNFSDPWPKNKDFEKRLTYRAYLKIYEKLLKPSGTLQFKTDNERLFDFSVSELKNTGFTIFEQTRNLAASAIENKYTTEYETRFTQQGLPIFYLKASI